MYYLFKPELRMRDDGECAATLENYGSRVGTLVPDTVPHWWEAKALTVPPPHLVFGVDTTVPLLDNYHKAPIFDLYSTKLIQLLAGAGVRFEMFPVSVVDYRTRMQVSAEYATFHLLEKHPVINTEAVKRQRWPIRERPFLLSDEIVGNPRPLFRMTERMSMVLIHRDLRHALEAAAISGCRYIPLDEAQW